MAQKVRHILNPDEKLQAEYEQKRVAYLEEKAALAQFVGKETKTARWC